MSSHSFTNIYGVLQFSSVAQLCPTLCDPMNHSTPGLPEASHHQLPEFTQTHVHWVSDAIQPSHPLSFPSPPAPNPSHHQSLFQWVNSSHEVARVLGFQLQHQSFQWTDSFRMDWLDLLVVGVLTLGQTLDTRNINLNNSWTLPSEDLCSIAIIFKCWGTSESPGVLGKTQVHWPQSKSCWFTRSGVGLNKWHLKQIPG